MKYIVKVEEVADDQWELVEDLLVQRGGWMLKIPAGFQTDLASIPRVLWNVTAPFELGLAGPIVHDWLYRHGGLITCVTPTGNNSCLMRYSRADADETLEDIMKQDGIAKWRRWSAYHAVRLFGGSSWKP